MKRGLLRYAILSTPILAIYALSPVLIFEVAPRPELPTLILGMFVNISVVWSINILITLRLQKLEKWKRYSLSYLFQLLFQLALFFISDFITIRSDIAEKYLSYPILISISFNAVIILLCNSVENAFKKNVAEIENRELKFQNSEAQKQLLLRQLHPHFLFNALSVLKSLIKEKPDTAEDYSLKLSDFLRYSAKASAQTLVTLKEELEFTTGYIELQKVRFENTFTFFTSIPSEVLNCRVPVYSIQTLVENAFKHNYFTEKNPLTIEVTYDANKLTITNNKVSIKVTERSGTGLVNLSQRHKLITGKEIDIVETENSFSVTIHLMA
ncbi:MAG: histidine kinase [Cytophagales bacterium]|nr:histidine kinase [Cytophagales bacterium]MCA6366440.1 histidine kinase [Cytophagales bacterium]MCA6373103.1 histidine kinase [Cytophagales bacterium]MCA6375545.1 histidine kinase [Cytophagales bacterium]MCA6382868.1 histidine kinase [Cytophagales bacterium]